jgi:putative hydrolase of the HAD superfamily
MPINVVTIDFWNTLYDATNGSPRRAARMDAFIEAARAAGYTCEPEQYDGVHQELWHYFDHHWLEKQRTPTSHEMICYMLDKLEFKLENPVIDQVAGVFESGVLDHPPSLLPGVREALEFFRSQGLGMALISDTAFSPGSILRQLMERDGVAEYFDSWIFSDETGVAKPHRDAFSRALEPFEAQPDQAFHVGDIERTDIKGAKGAGMRAVLYRGSYHDHKYAEPTTEADVVMDHWEDIGTVWEGLQS